MSDYAEKKVKALKEQLDKAKNEIERLAKENDAGLLSPLEKMRLNSLETEKRDLVLRIRELMM